MKKNNLIFIALFLVPIICFAKIRFIQTGAKEYKRTDWREVEVYITEKDIPTNVQKIGIMLCEGEDLRDIYKMFIKARKIASDYGATGIYILSEENNILSSKKYDKEDTKSKVRDGDDFKSKITFVAVRNIDSSARK